MAKLQFRSGYTYKAQSINNQDIEYFKVIKRTKHYIHFQFADLLGAKFKRKAKLDENNIEYCFIDDLKISANNELENK